MNQKLSQTKQRETREAIDLIEANLLWLLSQGSNWSASANLRLVRQLKKTIAPLVETTTA